MSKYRQLSNRLIEQIEGRARRIGDKMPSLRRFAEQYNVSMTTAIRCYQELQDKGYLKARSKSGFYVDKPTIADNALDFVHFKSEITELRSRHHVPGGGLKSLLATAQLGPTLLPDEALGRSIRYASKHAERQVYLYGDTQGSMALREALASHFREHSLAVSAQDLLITGGCLNAVALAVEAVSDIGDTIAVSSPCYSGLLQILALLKRKVVEIPSTQDGLDTTQLSALADSGRLKACLFTANHQNPTGHCLSVSHKQWLAEFANDRQIPLIEDDVFGELTHTGVAPLPIKAWDSGGYVIWCASASKSLAPGLRIGWSLPGRYLAAMMQRHQLTTGGLNVSMQLGVARFIQSGHYARHLQSVNRLLAHQVSDYRDYLQARLPKNCRISTPSGGLVLWLKLPGVDCEQLSQLAATAGLDLRHGGLFSSRGLYRDCLRLNIGWPLPQAEPLLELMLSLIACVQTS